MRLLHTSDWHLGGQLMNRDRREEHRRFLDWLLHCLAEQRIDVLVIAGDIFDSAAPPSYALELYYNFLRKLAGTGCRQAVIVGGNHDSMAVLNAPGRLLAALDITVIGGVPTNPDEQLVLVRDPGQKPLGLVCAVPFLRDRDLKNSVAGETWEERKQAVAVAVAGHYQQILDRAQALRRSLAVDDRQIPIIATGHLFAAEATVSDGERDIHVGSLGGLDAGLIFPPGFTYLALGHLHRPQKLSTAAPTRYSGSPLPLSFGEAATTKSVIVVDCPSGVDAPAIAAIEIPCFRRLVTLSGSPEATLTGLAELEVAPNEPTVWIQILLDSGLWQVDARQRLEALAATKNLDILAIRHRAGQKKPGDLQPAQETNALADLTPTDVFLRRLDEEMDIGDEDRRDLLAAFSEALTTARHREGLVP